jgi:UDP-glucose:(heptosyl)LPS alpha-1,3-glucosyltransferase
MKVALVHRRFTTHGGTERYLVGFARWLVAEGHDVHVLCNEVRADLQGEPGIIFDHLPMLRPAKLLSLWAAASSALGRASYDAVMGFGRTPGHQLFRAGGGSHVAALRRTNPIRRWISPEDWVEMAMDRAAVRSARVCIANSALGARGLVEDYGAARVEVVYNGVDLRRFRPDPRVRAELRAELGVTGPVALFLGTGFHRKGLDTAIAALPLGWTLWVAGKDRPWKAPACVRFLGPWADPERLLQAADVMILPTRYDPFANACLEALASGIPALTTPDNGAAEVLPAPWMVASDAAGFRDGLLRAEAEGGSLRDACRATAERFTTNASYTRAFALLQEASR